MRIGLIADLHGNSLALDAVLDALARDGVDRIVCLGDVAVFGPDPRGVLDRLRGSACPVVMGNTDAWALDPQPHPDRDAETPLVNAIELWGAAQLTAADRDTIRTFSPSVTLELDGANRLFSCHGSPRSFHEGIHATTSAGDLDAMLAGIDAPIIACAHTHTPLLRRHGRQLIVNPGSVGQPIELGPACAQVRYPPWAEYAILDGAGASLAVTLHRTPVDVAALIAHVRSVGMPYADWYAARWTSAQ